MSRFTQEELDISKTFLELAGILDETSLPTKMTSSTRTSTPNAADSSVQSPFNSSARVAEWCAVTPSSGSAFSSTVCTSVNPRHLLPIVDSASGSAEKTRLTETLANRATSPPRESELSTPIISSPVPRHSSIVGTASTLAETPEPQTTELERLRKAYASLHRRFINTRKQRDIYKTNASRIQKKYENMCLYTSKRFGKDQLDALSRGGNLRGTRWSDETVLKALRIHFSAGTTGYELVSSTQVPLPSTRVLRQRLEHIQFKPGVLIEVFEFLPAKVANMSDMEKECWIVMDEMSLRQAVEMDPSLRHYLGHCTLPGSKPLLTKMEREQLGNDPVLIAAERARRSQAMLNNKATKAMVFLLCGFGWKLTVCYEFTGNTFCSDTAADRVREIIRRSHSVGLFVRLLITDMGNRGLWKSLGIDASSTSSVISIPHPVVPEEDFFVMPDSVHVYKNTVQMLRTNKEIILHDDIVREFHLPSNTVKLEHLSKLCQFQDKMRWKLAPSISEELLKVNHFDKMKVKNSTDVFNRRVAAALLFLARITGAKDMEVTAWFINLVARWRELVTARTPIRGVGRRNPQAFSESLATLNTTMRVFNTMSAGKEWKPSQTGVKAITLVLLRLISVYLDDKGILFIMLGFFTTDPAENVFSCIRILHPNPTALQFRRRLKNLMVSQYLRHVSKSSYEADDRTELLDLLRHTKKEDPVTSPPVDDVPVVLDDEEEVVLGLSLQESNGGSKMDEIEKQVFYRVCGYIVKKIQEENPAFGCCAVCLRTCTINSAQPHKYADLLRATNFVCGALIEVSDEVFQLLLAAEEKIMAVDHLLYHLDTDLPSFLEKKICDIPVPETSALRQTCHDIPQMILHRYVKFRSKYMSTKASTLRACQGDKSQLSSFSMGSRFLASAYTPRRKDP